MKKLICLFLAIALLAGCAPKVDVIHTPGKKPRPGTKVKPTQRPYKIKGRTYYPLPSSEGFVQTGIASWYGKPFHGRKTSNGETYNMYATSAAHKTLPMGTNLLVTNLENGREVTLRINDRGPFVRGRIIDLSYKAAKELNIVKKGTAKVRIAALGEATVTKRNGRQETRFLPHQDFNQGDFYIQIGAFTNRDNAYLLRKKMEKRGHQVAITTFTSKGKLFHRVRIQAGHDLRQAEKLEKRFQNEGFNGAFVAAR